MLCSSPSWGHSPLGLRTLAAAPVEDVLLQEREEGLHGSVVAGGGDARTRDRTVLESSPGTLPKCCTDQGENDMVVLAKRSSSYAGPSRTTNGDHLWGSRLDRAATHLTDGGEPLCR